MQKLFFILFFVHCIVSTQAQTIVRVEYFIDSDPGFGNATSISITPDSVLNGITFNANVSSVNPGIHSLHIRSLDNNGKWSLTRTQHFYKFPAPLNSNISPTISKLEYFIDTDPGFGNAINVPITADSFISNFLFNVDMSIVNPGLHSLYIRSMDANGKWSLTRTQQLYKFPPSLNNNVSPNISKLEYFIDTDPGFGNAINVPITADSSISNFLFNVDMSAVTPGLHSLYIRSLDNSGKWSLTRNQQLYKFPPSLNNNVSPNISQLEYFIDTDPGFGNAINVPITADSSISNFLFNVDMSVVTPGLHSLYIRSRDMNGKWSLTRNQQLYKFPPSLNNNISPNISKLEYFIDTDPGFGNAINVPITADSSISNFLFNVDMSAVNPGLHSLYIRSRDMNGKWSLTRNQQLYKFPPSLNNNISPAITRVEYFIDSDPGFGNANNVSISSDSMLNAVPFNINVASLNPGIHQLSIRSLDANGKWSLTKHQAIYKFPAALNNGISPAVVKLEYFVDTDPGFGNASNIPVSADSSINNLIFQIDTSNLSLGTHTLYVRSLDINGKWSLTKNIKFSRNLIKLFIQGYYVGNNMMTPVLMNGGIGTDYTLTDSITVELRNTTSPYAIKESVRTLLHTDGTVRCSFATGSGSYYIAIKHRNSIETWSNAPVNINSNSSTHDFTTAASKAYGNKLKLVGSGVYAIYSGDINQDDNIDLLDSQLLENEIEAFNYGYKTADINGDGNVDLVDLPIEEINISNFIFSSHP